MHEDRHKFYPMASAYVTFPKKVEAHRPSENSGDQNTYMITLGKNAAVSVHVFATLNEMVEFAGMLERFVHEELAFQDAQEGTGC
jgi:hypothetical protein